MFKNTKIYLIGGNGFVGSGYYKHLSGLGYYVQVIDRSNYSNFVGTHCDVLINANGNSKKFLAKEDPKADFLASVTSVRNSLVDFNYDKYIFLSTSDIYPDCSNPELTLEYLNVDVARLSNYGFHKYLAELCVQHVANDWLIIRQGGFVGEGMKKNAVYDVLFGDKLWVHPDSEFQFMHTVDSACLVCELIAKGLTREIFNLSSVGTVSVREIMNIAGREVPYDDSLSPVTYQLSTQKVSNYINLPSSFDTIKAFISNLKI